jgi:(p)ppGpp synthase/HD superfamily hydrolase
MEIRTREEKYRVYHGQLEAAAAEVKLCKGADRLHNGRSMGALKPEKQQELIRETREHYIPLLQQAYTRFPEAVTYLITQLEAAMKPYEIPIS